MFKQSFLLGVLITTVAVVAFAPKVLRPIVVTKEKVVTIASSFTKRNYVKEASEIKSTLNKSKLKHLLIYINALCTEYNVDYDLVKAVITTESSWKHKAKSPAGAMGLMQVLPSTALGEFSTQAEDLYDPYVNVTVGIMYLSGLQKIMDFNRDKVLTAYSHGPTVTKKYSMRYISNNDYVDTVLANL